MSPMPLSYSSTLYSDKMYVNKICSFVNNLQYTEEIGWRITMRKRLNLIIEFALQKRNRRWMGIIAALVVFVTTYSLILPALTLESNAACGKEQHTHSKACYTVNQNLICAKEETDGHQHTEDCYDEEGNLTCTLEEVEAHHHDASCYEEESVMTCEKEEHKHTKDCYAAEEPAEEPSKKDDDSKKSDEEKTDKADKDDDKEKSDDKADVENSSVWEKSVAGAQITGVWADDLVSVANTQLGYKESTKNFRMVEGKKNSSIKKGYSRYGAWYGDNYGDWSGMFVSFCLRYAGIPETAVPQSADCDAWIDSLKAADIYKTRRGYTPVKGDIAILDLTDGSDADHAGIVTSVDGNNVHMIVGDSNNKVESLTYVLNNKHIKGYGVLPENPEMKKAEETGKKKAPKRKVETTEEDEDVEISETVTTSANDGEKDLTPYIKNIKTEKVENGKWASSKEFTEGQNIRVEMAFEVPANVVTSDSPSIAYTLPKGFVKPGTQMSGIIEDEGFERGTYTIESDSEGNAKIVLTYNQDFANGQSFTGNVFFDVQAAVGEGKTESEYSFPGSGTTITVKKPEEKHDIWVNKNSNVNSAGKIDYSITVSSNNGTGEPVTITDEFMNNGATYDGVVTIKKFNSAGQEVQENIPDQQVSGSKFTFDLPELAAGEKYEISYSASPNEEAASGDGSLKVTNNAKGNLKNHPDVKSESKKETPVSEPKVQKYGQYNQITGQMDFTVTVNNPQGLDLGGRELVDIVTSKNAELISDPVVTDNSGNVVTGGGLVKNPGSNENLYSYQFPAGSTSNKYTIKYSTSAPNENGAAVNNKVTYKGDGSKDYEASSNPQVNLRTFGMDKSSVDRTRGADGLEKFTWQTYMTLPTGNFPQDGYLFEDTIMDASQDGKVFEDSHYGIKSEIEQKIKDTFQLKVLEGTNVSPKNWEEATGNYVDVEIKYYTSKGGAEVTGDDQKIKYFTVNVKPKNGKEFSAAEMYFDYITSGNKAEFEEGTYNFKNEGKVGDHTKTPDVPVDNGHVDVNKKLTESPDNNADKNAEWESEISLPESTFPEKGYTYKDTIEDAKDGHGVSYPGTHYGTKSEIENKIRETFKLMVEETDGVSYSEATSKYVDVIITTYDKDPENGGQVVNDDESPVNFFTVEIKAKEGVEFIATKCTYRYTTHTNLNGINGGKITFDNKAQIGVHNSTAKYETKVKTSFEKSVFTGKDREGNDVEWNYNPTQYVGNAGTTVDSTKKTLNQFTYGGNGAQASYGNDGIITYRILVNPGADQDITVTDTIPEGMEFTGNAYATAVQFDASIDDTRYSISEGGSVQNYTTGQTFVFNDHLTTSMDGNQLKITLGKGYLAQGVGGEFNGCLYAIYYQLKITDPAWNNPKFTKKSYVNSVTWEEKGKTTSQETEVERPIPDVQKIADPVETSTGAISAIKYTVIINSTAKDLDPSSDILELVDTLNTGNHGIAEMQLESIKLYEYDDNATDHVGAEVNPSRYSYHYADNTKKLSFNVPDELACVLQYTYNVSTGDAAEKYTISNNVSLLGKVFNGNDVTMEEKHSGADSHRPLIKLYKVDANNYGKKLAEVQFSLEMLTGPDQWGDARTITTDENGQILFDKNDKSGAVVMQQNKLYRIIETVNNNRGYQVDATPYYVVWLDGQTTAKDWYDGKTGETHASIHQDNIHFFENAGGNIYVENEFKEVAVKKVWVDSDGTDLEKHEADVTVQLHEGKPTGKTLHILDGSNNVTNTYYVADNTEIVITTSLIWNNDNTTYDVVGIDSSYVNAEIISVNDAPLYRGNAKIVYTIDSNGLEPNTNIRFVSGTNTISANDWTVQYTRGGYTEGDPVGEPVTLNASNDWSNHWENLPSGKTYIINEMTIGGKPVESTDYQISYRNNGIETGEIVIENKKPKQVIPPEPTELSIEKKWTGEDGKELNTNALQGKKATFRIMQVADGDMENASEYDTFTLPENGNWKKEFKDIPKTTYDSVGNPTHYKYYFEEVTDSTAEVTYQKESIWNFLPFVDGTETAEKVLLESGSVTVTNKLKPQNTDISVEKVWKDPDGNTKDPSTLESDASVSLDLYRIREDEEQGEKINDETIVLNSQNGWKYEKKDLLKEEYKDGVKHTYKYYFIESEVSGYNTTYKNSETEESTPSTVAVNGGTITVINKEQRVDKVTVNKQWFKKNTDGSVTDITKERDGYINFNIYRVATRVEPAHEHSWSEWTVTTPATETTEGVETRTCSGCGETETKPIETLAHTHNYSSQVTKEATCTEEGVRTYTCSCGKSYTESIPMIAHTLSDRIGVKEATPTEPGYTGDVVCTVCGTIIESGEEIPATGGGSSDESVTVRLIESTSYEGATYYSVNVTKNTQVQFVGTITNQGYNEWYQPDLTAQYDGKDITAEKVSSDDYKTITYTFTVTADADKKIVINHNQKGDISWTHNIANSAKAPKKKALRNTSIRKANDNKQSTSSANIPAGAVKLNEQTLQIHAKNGWKWEGTYEAEEGYTYTYYVEEVDNSGNFEVEYQNQGSDNPIIKNTVTEKTYELPHTGGMGTTPIKMLGLLLMVSGLAGFMIKTKKCGREGN